MAVKPRAQRWPSAWTLALYCDGTAVPVRVLNVSETGLRYAGPVLPGSGQVRLHAMGQPVYARVVRWEKDGGALQFDRPITAAQLATLRQYRDYFPG